MALFESRKHPGYCFHDGEREIAIFTPVREHDADGRLLDYVGRCEVPDTDKVALERMRSEGAKADGIVELKPPKVAEKKAE